MAWYVWTEDETEFFIKCIKDKSITGKLDSKQQRNALKREKNFFLQ